MNKKKTTTVKDKDLEKQVADTKRAILMQKDFKDWVEKKFQEVIDRFYIDFVSMNFNYRDQGHTTKDGNVIFTVSANEKYHQMSINVFPAAMKMWENGKKESLIDGIVHECAHLHTDRLSKLADDRYATRSQIHDANEHLTEVVAQYVRTLIKKEAPQIYNK